jgi:predicted RecA/RadA family phage recombinase
MTLWNSDLSVQENCQNKDGAGNGGKMTMTTRGFIPGDWYFISVDTRTNQPGDFGLCLYDYDTQDGAYEITNATAYCSADAQFTTVGGNPNHSNQSCNTANKVADRWFKITVPASGELLARVFSNDPSKYGDMVDPVVTLWNAAGNTELACSKAFGHAGAKETQVGYTGLSPGTQVYLSVDVEDITNAGSFTLCLSDNFDYDWVAGAQELTVGVCSALEEYTTVGATPDQLKPSCHAGAGTQPISNRWFKAVVPASGELMLRLLSDDPGGNGDMIEPVLVSWNENLTELKCASAISYNGLRESFIRLTAADGISSGDVVYFSVDVEDIANAGTFTICLYGSIDYNWIAGARDITANILNGSSCGANNVNGSTNGATPDGPTPPCVGGVPDQNVWYKFQAPASGVIGVTFFSSSDLYNYAFDVWSVSGGSLTNVNCGTWYHPHQSVSFGAVGLNPGDDYYISIDSYNNTHGDFEFCINQNPTFDFVDYAETLIVDGASKNRSNQQASADGADSDCKVSNVKKNVWFKFQAISEAVTVNLTAASDPGGQALNDPLLTIFDTDKITELNCNRVPNERPATVSTDGLTPGNWYYVSIDSYNARFGAFNVWLTDGFDYDYYQGAIQLVANSQSGTETYSNYAATPDGPGTTCSGSLPKLNRWFKFTANSEQNIIRYIRSNVNRVDDVILTLYEDTNPNPNAITLNQVDCVDAGNNSLDWRVNTIIGKEYYVSVDSRTGDTGQFGMGLYNYDTQTGAHEITDATAYCSADAQFTTVGGNPNHSNQSCNTANKVADRWFKITVPASGELLARVFSNDPSKYGDMVDPVVTLWNAAGNTELACSKAFGHAAAKETQLGHTGISPGTQVYLSVDVEDPADVGSFTLCLSDAVDYDWVAGALTLTDGNCSAVKAYTTIGATPDQNKPSCHPDAGSEPIANRWFKMQVPTSGIVDVTVICNSTLWGTMTNPVVTLWDADLNELECEVSDPLNNVNTNVRRAGLTSGD